MNTESDDFRLAQRYAYKQLLGTPTTIDGKTYESRLAAQSVILRGVKDPEANRRAVKTVYGALEQDAADAARLAKYNELAEANRPVKGDQKLYDQLTEKGRARFVGGRFEQTLASLGTASASTPVKQTQPTRAADGSPLIYVQDSQWRPSDPGSSPVGKRATDDLDKMLSQGGTLVVDPLSGKKTVQDLAGRSRAATAEDLASARDTAETLKDAGMGHDTVEFSLFGDPRRRKVLGGTQQAAKAGDSPHKNFRNFLASDKVPDSIFGYPVVQDERGYTPEDIEFFKKNPKAAGFYDLGSEEMTEDVPQQAAGAGVTMLASIFGPAGLGNLRKAGWKNLPKLASYRGHGHEIHIGELKDVRLRKGWEQVLLWKKKKLSDILDFSSPQGERLVTAYPGIQDIPVTNEDRGPVRALGGHGGTVGQDEYIWLNPRSIGVHGSDITEQYDTILHEGINHAIYAREPSFIGPNVATHIKGGGELTPLGYAMNLNEVLADLASGRGVMRAKTGRGSADSKQLVAEILPHMVKRVRGLSEAELRESQGKMLVEDLELARAADPADEDLPLEEPVPDHEHE